MLTVQGLWRKTPQFWHVTSSAVPTQAKKAKFLHHFNQTKTEISLSFEVLTTTGVKQQVANSRSEHIFLRWSSYFTS